MPNSPRNFAHQDLRDRSFGKQQLSGADFSGADLRGCDFSKAVLVGANFSQAKMGSTSRQRVKLMILVLLIALLAADAISRLIFGALGQTPAEPAWKYVLALYANLGTAGTGAGLQTFALPKMTAWLANSLSAAASGGLIGFYYAGSLTGENPQFAIAGALVGALAMAIVSTLLKNSTVAVILTVTGTIAAYGLAFLLGTSAIAFLSTARSIEGLILACFSFLYLWLTMRLLAQIWSTIQRFPGTRFRHAVLTNAKFDDVMLEKADFRDAIDFRL